MRNIRGNKIKERALYENTPEHYWRQSDLIGHLLSPTVKQIQRGACTPSTQPPSPPRRPRTTTPSAAPVHRRRPSSPSVAVVRHASPWRASRLREANPESASKHATRLSPASPPRRSHRPHRRTRPAGASSCMTRVAIIAMTLSRESRRVMSHPRTIASSHRTPPHCPHRPADARRSRRSKTRTFLL